MIVALESLRLAATSLRANPMRAALTILGMVIGIAAVVALMAIGSGAQQEVEDQFTSFGTDTVTIQVSQFTSDAALTSDDLAAVRDAPGVRRAVYTVDANATISYGDTALNAQIVGTSPQIESIDRLELQAGSFFSSFAAAHDLPVAVIGANLLEELDLPATQIVGETLRIGGRSYEVIGVLSEQGGISFSSADDSVLVPLGAITGRLVSYDPDISRIRVQAATGAEETYVDTLTAALRSSRGISSNEEDDFRVVDATSIASAVSESSGTLTKLMAAIAAISLVVGGIGIANVMLVTVRERTREIGIRRAVGASRRDIVVQFVVDAIVIGLIGGILGLAAGLGGAYAGGRAVEVTPQYSWVPVALALSVSVVVGLLAGIGPAVQAASVEPTTALRYE